MSQIVAVILYAYNFILNRVSDRKKLFAIKGMRPLVSVFGRLKPNHNYAW